MIFRNILSFYLPQAPLGMVYMLQQVEYNPWKFADWINTIPHLARVQKRKKLDKTLRATFMLIAAYTAYFGTILAAIGLAANRSAAYLLVIGLAAPVCSVLSMFFLTVFMQRFVVDPAQNKEISKASGKMGYMTATRIAVLGSYGKTTMKELLKTVLSEGKKTAATPGNKNVLISHARWINSQLSGDEEVLIFEYGEAQPGDIARLSNFSKPDFAVITGLAPAHLDDYGTLDAIAADFSDIDATTSTSHIYLNGESPELITRLKHAQRYTIAGVNGWKVSNIRADLTGLDFILTKDKRKLKLHSSLIGLHQIGPLAAVVDIAARLGLSDQQIIDGVAKTTPFEHRMQPYKLGGAWIIDDTYNGNIEAAKAGLTFLKELEAAGKKIYVTPGLVEQGDLKEDVHIELGQAIANANVDRVILMRNSVTEYIEAGLQEAGYEGDLIIEANPLEFYTGLEHFVAGGDVVLLQNDWPDAYM